MRTLVELLPEIRKRPGMYLGNSSVENLKSFLDGYQFALDGHQIKERPIFDDQLSFHDWIALRTHFYESTSGWANMLNDRYGVENAIEMFFVHYDEYLNRSGAVVNYAIPVQRALWRTVVQNGIELFCYLTPWRVELVRYTNDPGLFVRFIDSVGKIIDREEYVFDQRSISLALLNIKIDNWVDVCA